METETVNPTAPQERENRLYTGIGGPIASPESLQNLRGAQVQPEFRKAIEIVNTAVNDQGALVEARLPRGAILAYAHPPGD
jgi:hypothetical protein